MMPRQCGLEGGVEAHRKGAVQRLQAVAWLSGIHLGGSRDSRSPVPSNTALRETCMGGADGTRATSDGDSSSAAAAWPCEATTVLSYTDKN